MKSLREFLGLCAHTWVIDDERLSEYALFTVGDPLEIQLVVKS